MKEKYFELFAETVQPVSVLKYLPIVSGLLKAFESNITGQLAESEMDSTKLRLRLLHGRISLNFALFILNEVELYVVQECLDDVMREIKKINMDPVQKLQGILLVKELESMIEGLNTERSKLVEYEGKLREEQSRESGNLADLPNIKAGSKITTGSLTGVLVGYVKPSGKLQAIVEVISCVYDFEKFDVDQLKGYDGHVELSRSKDYTLVEASRIKQLYS